MWPGTKNYGIVFPKTAPFLVSCGRSIMDENVNSIRIVAIRSMSAVEIVLPGMDWGVCQTRSVVL